jgi:hypothetical protein
MSLTRNPNQGAYATQPPEVGGRAQIERPAGSLTPHHSGGVSQSAGHSRPGHIAVVGPHGIVWTGADAKQAWPVRPWTIRELGCLSERLGIDQFWVHDSALESLGLPQQIRLSRANGFVLSTFTSESGSWVSSRPGLCTHSHWYQKGVRGGFDLHIPHYSTHDRSGRSPFADTESPAELLIELLRFEGATGGMVWRGTGAMTSERWLRERLRSTLTTTELPPPITERSVKALEVACMWHRRPNPQEENYRYCHSLDLNLSYAAPASSVELPTGAVEHREWPTFDKTLPGIYLFEPDPWVGELPPPWSMQGQFEDSTAMWVTAPTAERMTQLGYEPLEAWVWPEVPVTARGKAVSRRHLRGWYEVLRDARTELLPGGGAALEAVKVVCRTGLGRMASEARTLRPGMEYLDDDPTYQPYWDWAVIAELRCRVQRRISQLSVMPVAVITDALYFLSSRADPPRLGEVLGLPIGDGLGEFKAGGTISAKDAREALDTDESSWAGQRLLEAFKAVTRA